MSMKNIASNKSKSSLSELEESQVQPNAVDIKLDRLFTIDETDTFEISESVKIHRGSVEVQPTEDNKFVLNPHTSYQFLAEGEVSVSEGEAGHIITRSTLNRNGVFITSGLYDSGYTGVMAGAIHNVSGKAIISKGTRVGQFVLYDAESLHNYDGDYGTGKMDEVLYSK